MRRLAVALSLIVLMVGGSAGGMSAAPVASAGQGDLVQLPFPTPLPLQLPADRSLCKFDIWRELTLDGAPFGNQGDCVSSMNHGGAAVLPDPSWERMWTFVSAPPGFKPTLCSGVLPCDYVYSGLQEPYGGKPQALYLPVGQTQPSPQQPAPIGMDLEALQGHIDSVSGCTPFGTGTVSLTASGNALGPYAGSFTADATITFGPDPSRDDPSFYWASAGSLHATVDSPNGTIGLDWTVVPTTTPGGRLRGVQGECHSFGGVIVLQIVGLFTTLVGTVAPAGGIPFADQGDSILRLQLVRVGSGTIGSVFEADASSNLYPSPLGTLSAPGSPCPPGGCT